MTKRLEPTREEVGRQMLKEGGPLCQALDHGCSVTGQSPGQISYMLNYTRTWMFRDWEEIIFVRPGGTEVDPFATISAFANAVGEKLHALKNEGDIRFSLDDLTRIVCCILSSEEECWPANVTFKDGKDGSMQTEFEPASEYVRENSANNMIDKSTAMVSVLRYASFLVDLGKATEETLSGVTHRYMQQNSTAKPKLEGNPIDYLEEVAGIDTDNNSSRRTFWFRYQLPKPFSDQFRKYGDQYDRDSKDMGYQEDKEKREIAEKARCLHLLIDNGVDPKVAYFGVMTIRTGLKFNFALTTAPKNSGIFASPSQD